MIRPEEEDTESSVYVTEFLLTNGIKSLSEMDVDTSTLTEMDVDTTGTSVEEIELPQEREAVSTLKKIEPVLPVRLARRNKRQPGINVRDAKTVENVND